MKWPIAQKAIETALLEAETEDSESPGKHRDKYLSSKLRKAKKPTTGTESLEK